MSMQETPPGAGKPPRGGPKAANMVCAQCGGRMVVKQVSPVLFASGIDEVVTGCEKCATEVKRTVKRL